MKIKNNKMATMKVVGNQEGMVLITGLIMLLIMTLLGTASMQGATFEEKMSANDMNHTIAFQAAESAVEMALSDRSNLAGALSGVNTIVSVDLQETKTLSNAEVEYLSKGPASGYSLGDEDSFVTYSFEIAGSGKVPAVAASTETTHGVNVIAPDNS